ncbi:MAG: DUF4261 domain-containing protein [Ruminococcus sp.]|nr:DUF4261 domain-containing protein [Ruminococcus sp.]
MSEEIFEQNDFEEEQLKQVFSMRLLFDKNVSLPGAETVKHAAEGFLGNVKVDAVNNCNCILCLDRTVGPEDGKKMPVMLVMSECTPIDNSEVNGFDRSQMWDCPEHDKVFEECPYSVTAVDMLAAGLSAQDRAELEMDWLSLLLELFPNCRAVFFMNSRKLFKAEDIRARTLPDQQMFTYFAVNVRFFRVQDTEDMLVDTLGMSTLGLPDLQYHFHGANPNHVVRHAYNLLGYILEFNCPFKQGDTIDGFDENGNFSESIQWKCSFENALIQPVRSVIDIEMGELASGVRDR